MSSSFPELRFPHIREVGAENKNCLRIATKACVEVLVNQKIIGNLDSKQSTLQKADLHGSSKDELLQ